MSAFPQNRTPQLLEPEAQALNSKDRPPLHRPIVMLHSTAQTCWPGSRQGEGVCLRLQ